MSTARNLALQALKELVAHFGEQHGGKYADADCVLCQAISHAHEAIAALLAETAEPVAYRVYDPVAQSEDLYFEDDLGDMDGKEITPLYAAPIEHAAWVDGSKKSTLPIYREEP